MRLKIAVSVVRTPPLGTIRLKCRRACILGRSAPRSFDQLGGLFFHAASHCFSKILFCSCSPATLVERLNTRSAPRRCLRQLFPGGQADDRRQPANWHPLNNPGTSFCNDADCWPTRGYVNGERRWRALEQQRGVGRAVGAGVANEPRRRWALTPLPEGRHGLLLHAGRDQELGLAAFGDQRDAHQPAIDDFGEGGSRIGRTWVRRCRQSRIE